MERVMIGVDGGGTKTVAVASRMDGTILAAQRGIGINYNNGENTVLSIDNNNNNSEVIYSNIVEQLKANGVPDEYASGIMTQKEWARRKGSSRASETGSTAVTSFDTYQDYLTFYTEYLIEQYGS